MIPARYNHFVSCLLFDHCLWAVGSIAPRNHQPARRDMAAISRTMLSDPLSGPRGSSTSVSNVLVRLNQCLMGNVLASFVDALR
jgi:hypothetical protein